MNEPDFSMYGVEESECFCIKDGENIIGRITEAAENGAFSAFDFGAYDGNNNDYFFECIGFVIMNRKGKDRLYLAVKDLEEEKDCWRGAYIARRADGVCLLVPETDDAIYDELIAKFNDDEAVPTVSDDKKKKSGKALKIILTIITFPFWLLWQFIKALLELFNIGFGDSSAVKAFKRGYNGEDTEYKEYTLTNDMGCQQTVYSSNGRDFYDSNGSYVGSSNDGGKTIK